MRILITLLLLLTVTVLFSQKKVVPVAVSEMTGIGLPNGSTKDKRLLSTISGRLLLEMESKKDGTGIGDVEVLYLPPVSKNNFGADSLVAAFSQLGWSMNPIDRDNKYLWLQKDGKSVLVYFEMQPKETQLYFGIAATTPSTGAGMVTTPPANTTPPSDPNPLPEPAAQQNNIIPTPPPPPSAAVDEAATSSPGNNGITISTINFDDGWTSTVQEDWVQVVKGGITVLIHYPNKKADEYNSVLLEGLKNAWNVLVAPRYSNSSAIEFKPISSWQSIEFAEGELIEKITGKKVHVVFFKKNFSGGEGKYLEFIAPDKASFEREFGAYSTESYAPIWDKMAGMAGYNKFAVAASDLKGKWTNNFSGIQQYVNAYTGASAGMDTHASSQVYIFSAGATYIWNLSVASGFVGNIKFQNVKSEGKFSLPGNWEIYFSDIEGKPGTYPAYFSCIKGARILWLNGTAFGLDTKK